MRRVFSGLVLLILLVGTLTLTVNIQPVKSDYTWTQTIYIQADGSIQPPTAPISSVNNVTYKLTDNIGLVRADGIVIERDSIVLNGAGYTVTGSGTETVGITLTSRSNVTVNNMTIENFTDGINLESSSGNSLSGNNVINNEYGIELYDSSSNNSIVANNITENNGDGIYLGSSSYNSLSGNNITANGEAGVWLDFYSSYNIVSGNKITNNGDGIDLYSSANSTFSSIVGNSITGNNITANNYEGIYLGSSSYNSLSGNNITANGDNGIYLDESSDNNSVSGNNITANANSGIDLYSSYNGVSGNIITENSVDGIYLYSSYTSVSGNNITANGLEGIILDSSSSNSVSGNNITANANGGILLYYSSSNGVSGNNITNNYVEGDHDYIGGIYLYYSSNNTIYHNNIIGNTPQVSSDGSPNTWDNGYPSGGNHWSDYGGTDSFNGAYQDFPGSDGIGDTPYVIDSNNMDHYPLMQPWSLSQSTTSISISPNPVVVGWPVTCIARVSGSRLTGTVTWCTSSIGGSFSQSVCTLSNGTCSTTYTDNFTGFVTIAAYYSGDNMPSSGSTTLLVTSGGPVYYSQNYTSVQAAINAAPSGANVIIGPGFYNESLTINKRLTIIGEKDPPVFSGGSSATYLTLLSGASGSTVTGIEITNFQEGILVDNAGNVSIYGNIMASMGSSGIVLQGSGATGNVICDNIFQDTPTPINLTASAGGNKIYGNIITSQTSLTLNIGTDGNVVYANSMSASQITLNMTNSNGNIFYHNNFQSSVQITGLAAGNNMWNDSYPSGGNYWSSYIGTDSYSGPYQDITGPDGIGDTPYHVGTNSVDNYPLMKPQNMTAGHCVAVVSVVAAKTVIGQRFTEVGAGFSDNVTVLVADKGNYIESFSVTLCVNSTCIGTQQVSGLNPSCLMVLGFAWNTSSLAYGNYTVSVYAQPVAGQTDVSGNVFTLGTVKVTIPGDINGDFKVSLADLVLLANAYGTTPATGGNPGVPHAWNPNADIDGNAVVGLSDLVIMAYYFGQHYP